MKRVSDKFRAIADMVETIETIETMQPDHDITRLTPTSDNILTENPTITFDIEIPFLTDDTGGASSEITPKEVNITDEGSLHIEFVVRVSELDSNDDTSEVQTSNTQSSTGEPDPKRMATATSSKTEDATTSTESATDDSPTTESEVLPSYRDQEQLREAYDEYDTFAEMTDALDVDVTSQTVRRYAIKYGIHEPASNTGSQSAEKLLNADPDSVSESREEESPEPAKPTAQRPAQTETQNTTTSRRVSTDGHGGIRDDDENEGRLNGDCDEIEAFLPEHLTLDDIKTTARSAKTLYEAQQQLDLERDEARRLLRELDLLDFVHGRLTTRDVTDQTIEDINQRLQSTTTTDSGRA